MSQITPLRGRAPDDPGISRIRASVLRGCRLLMARGIWLLLAAGLLANVIAGIPTYFRLYQTVCTSEQRAPRVERQQQRRHTGQRLQPQ